MKTKHKIAFVLVTALAVDFAQAYYRNKKGFVKNLDLLKKREDQLLKMTGINTFFAGKLDEANVPLDEFDKIVLNSLIDN